MAEDNMLSEVRTAKAWVDGQSATLRELGLRLAAVEQAYRARIAEFSGLPRERPQSVSEAVRAADDEPGRGLLSDVRPGGSK